MRSIHAGPNGKRFQAHRRRPPSVLIVCCAGLVPFDASRFDVRRIPAWILLVLAILTAALLIVGIHEREHIGPVPMILAVLWGLFVLGSAPQIFSQKDHTH